MKTIAILLTSLTIASCTQQELDRVSDASHRRRIVCDFIRSAAVDNPAVRKAREYCNSGGDLELIARAYGGCEAEE